MTEHAVHGELLAVRRLLLALGNNVNQIAHVGGDLPGSLDAALARVMATAERVDVLADPSRDTAADDEQQGHPRRRHARPGPRPLRDAQTVGEAAARAARGRLAERDASVPLLRQAWDDCWWDRIAQPQSREMPRNLWDSR